jgi:hypothetical protein
VQAQAINSEIVLVSKMLICVWFERYEASLTCHVKGKRILIVFSGCVYHFGYFEIMYFSFFIIFHFVAGRPREGRLYGT